MAGLPGSGDQSFSSSSPDPNLKQLLQDAQSRWLKPAEVCEILNSHHSLPLSEVSPVKPTSGSLFLFDRNKLRYFRKDGHNWRKKKDGKTVREAHEKLKAGNKDAIHCYYAHGEENPNFQRRSYWLLEGGYEHIVLVHYREVTESSRLETSAPTFEENTGQYYSQIEPAQLIYENSSDYLTPSLISSPSEMVSSSYNSQGAVIDVDSGDEFGNNQLTRERQASVLEIFSTELGLDSLPSPSYAPELGDVGLDNAAHTSKSMTHIGPTTFDSTTYDVLQSQHDLQFQRPAANQELTGKRSHDITLEEGFAASPWSTLLESTYTARNDSDHWKGFSQSQQLSIGKSFESATSLHQYKPTLRQRGQTGQYMGHSGDSGEAWSFENIENQPESGDAHLQSFRAKAGVQHHMECNVLSESLKDEEEAQTSKKGLLSPTVSLIMHSIGSDPANLSDLSWEAVNLDPNALSLSGQINFSATPDPVLSQGLPFSIVDFEPKWSYAFEETKVLVTGVFLDPVTKYSNVRWICVFGEREVPADLLQSGALRCTAPPHEAGRVPFYVTCSDKTASSNIQEFEFRNKFHVSPTKSEADGKRKQQEQVMLHQARFAELLLTREKNTCAQEASNDFETIQKQTSKLESLMVDESNWSQIEALIKNNQHPFEDAKAMLVETFFKSALHHWLQRTKNVSLLNKHGLGVLHMAAALGYEWAIAPILSAGVGVNFRDERGWTALHWAAFCGREKIIALLLAADADPGAHTDPTPNDSTGRTASDLAASSGHNGIAGYLGEAILTSHLSSLNLLESEMSKVSAAVAGDQAIDILSQKCTAVDISLSVTDDELSLRDSLAAVRNAAQAGARITATYRAYSFLRKRELEDSSLDEFGMLEEEARAFAVAQSCQRASANHEKSNLAATQIQCKYRGWRARSDFLALKRQVVKIQAHVRGHQARKKYKKILWSVGFLEKAILRWRRKGSGLRGFKGEGIEEEDSDDDAYLKDFRRQKEAAFGEAVNQVKMLLQNPEARSQYRRLLEINQNEKGAQLDEDLISPDELMVLLG